MEPDPEGIEVPGAPAERMKDLTGFTRWLMRRRKEQSPTGEFAKVIHGNPLWPYPETRQDMLAHLRQVGVRAFLIEVANKAWTEYEQWESGGDGKQKARARSRRAKAARKKNRARGGSKRKR